MEIKILGTGCPNCKELERRVRNVLAELGIAANVEKVMDIKKIVEFKVLGTPGLVIDGKVASSGRVPTPAEIEDWVRGAAG
jgi:small redox-active disulfide protein 2